MLELRHFGFWWRPSFFMTPSPTKSSWDIPRVLNFPVWLCNQNIPQIVCPVQSIFHESSTERAWCLHTEEPHKYHWLWLCRLLRFGFLLGFIHRNRGSIADDKPYGIAKLLRGIACLPQPASFTLASERRGTSLPRRCLDMWIQYDGL